MEHSTCSVFGIAQQCFLIFRVDSRLNNTILAVADHGSQWTQKLSILKINLILIKQVYLSLTTRVILQVEVQNCQFLLFKIFGNGGLCFFGFVCANKTCRVCIPVVT